MEAKPTFFRHWDDVVFENRNKLYGAYLLRREYAGHLFSGLGVTLIFVALILSLQKIFSADPIAPVMQPPVTQGDIKFSQPPVIPARPPRRQPDQPRQSSAVNRTVLVTREVVEQEQVEAVVHYVEGEGDQPGDFTGEPEGIGTIPQIEVQPLPAPAFVDHAEVMPQYEGGLEAMMKFIQKKMHYPRVPRQLRIDGTVYVRFVVNADGSVSDVEVIKSIHPDCDKEASRVISMLPGWKGGSQNGRPVSVRMVLPIKFRLE